MILGFLLLSAAIGFLLVRSELGGLTALILGALLQILGVAAAAYAANRMTHAFPLSEAAATSRRWLFLCAIVVIPLSLAAALAWLTFVAPSFQLLFPAHALFWGPLAGFASIGFVYSARELASERMAILAATGTGVIIAMAASSLAGSLLSPPGEVPTPRVAWDLILVALGFLLLAIAFERDAWIVRSRRMP